MKKMLVGDKNGTLPYFFMNDKNKKLHFKQSKIKQPYEINIDLILLLLLSSCQTEIMTKLQTRRDYNKFLVATNQRQRQNILSFGILK